MHEETRHRYENPRLHLEQEQTANGEGSHQEANAQRYQQKASKEDRDRNVTIHPTR